MQLFSLLHSSKAVPVMIITGLCVQICAELGSGLASKKEEKKKAQTVLNMAATKSKTQISSDINRAVIWPLASPPLLAYEPTHQAGCDWAVVDCTVNILFPQLCDCVI